MRHARATHTLLMALTLAASACGPSKPAPAQPGTATASVASTPPPPPPPPPPIPPPPNSGKDLGIAVDYTITARDCDDLAARFHDVTRADMMAQLGDKQTEAQRAAAEKGIEQMANQARDGYLKQCDGLIDKVYERPRIDCALEARTVSAFDTCLNE